MFKKTYKLHVLRILPIEGLRFYLCYFWQDDSIFSDDYRRYFVLLPEFVYLKDGDFEFDKLVDYIISFTLAKSLYNCNLTIKHYNYERKSLFSFAASHY